MLSRNYNRSATNKSSYSKGKKDFEYYRCSKIFLTIAVFHLHAQVKVITVGVYI